MASARIAILFLERDKPEGYTIWPMAGYWREEGLSVDILQGTKHYVPADLLILHINLSVVPESYLRFARRYPRVINLAAIDIRKRSFSSLLLDRDSDYRGPVIVKTDLNYSGLPEVYYHPNLLYRRLCRWRRRKLGRLSSVQEGSVLAYPTFNSIQDVPDECWNRRYLVVEKFLPEKIDDGYAIRTYHFLGSRETTFLMKSREALINSDTVYETTEIETDDRLRKMREHYRFDYGKFDYVMVEGQPVLLDMNKTTGFSPTYAHSAVLDKVRRQRARGIYDFLS